MISAFILSVALLGADEPPAIAAAVPQPALEAYREAVARTGKNADAQVRLALWCEAHGLTAERLKHLSLAVLYEPKNALARGLMGLVAYQGKWERPEQVSQEVQDDAQQKMRIKDYLERRAKAPDRAEDQWKLALWCEQNELRSQATAHLFRVVQLDPKRESAWKRLGYKRVGGRWIKPDDAAAAKVEAQQQKRANARWKPILERLRSALESKSGARRAEAAKALSEITDRRAVPLVWSTFALGSPALRKVAVRLFGQIDDASASRLLAMLAVFGGSSEVRRQAVETLRQRDAREFAGLLIALIQKPIKYTVKKVGGPDQPGELLIKGEGSTPNLKRVYSPPAGSVQFYVLPDNERQVGSLGAVTTIPALQAEVREKSRELAESEDRTADMLARSGLGAPSQILARILTSPLESQVTNLGRLLHIGESVKALGTPTNHSSLVFSFATAIRVPLAQPAVAPEQMAVLAAENQLESDVNAIVVFNASLSEINDRVVPVLNDLSGTDIGADPSAWQRWLNDMVGYNSTPAPDPLTITQQVPIAYQPPSIPLQAYSVPVGVQRVSCFGAGTLVRTLAGAAPIESLRLGDQVLTQNTRTGALGYKPILTVHHNPPSKTYEIKVGDDTLVSSYFHRFWKSGAGWVMARDLKVGDPIRTLSGTVKVTAIEDGKVVPVFNLDVAEDADFFVGEVGALAHDNTVPDLRETPFDAVAVSGHPENTPRDQSRGEGKP